MKTLLPCLFAAWAVAACATPLRAEEALPSQLRIEPATTSVPLGKARLGVDPLTRPAKGDAWQGNYTVEVSPLSFASEQGRLTINVSNEAFHRLAAGQPIDFSGQADSASGNRSTVQGTATPAGGGKDSGAINVRINSKKGKLVFKTTYHLVK